MMRGILYCDQGYSSTAVASRQLHSLQAHGWRRLSCHGVLAMGVDVS